MSNPKKHCPVHSSCCSTIRGDCSKCCEWCFYSLGYRLHHSTIKFSIVLQKSQKSKALKQIGINTISLDPFSSRFEFLSFGLFYKHSQKSLSVYNFLKFETMNEVKAIIMCCGNSYQCKNILVNYYEMNPTLSVLKNTQEWKPACDMGSCAHRCTILFQRLENSPEK